MGPIKMGPIISKERNKNTIKNAGRIGAIFFRTPLLLIKILSSLTVVKRLFRNSNIHINKIAEIRVTTMDEKR